MEVIYHGLHKNTITKKHPINGSHDYLQKFRKCACSARSNIIKTKNTNIYLPAAEKGGGLAPMKIPQTNSPKEKIKPL